MVYITRSVARIIDCYFPESNHGGLSSGGLTLEQLVYYRHLHELEELRNIDPSLVDQDMEMQDGLDEEDEDVGDDGSEYADSDDGELTTSDVERFPAQRPAKRRKIKNKHAASQLASSTLEWSGPVPPNVPYDKIASVPSASLPSTGSIRRDKRRARSSNRRGIQSEAYVARGVFLDVTEDARASNPLWCGLNAHKDDREFIKGELGLEKVLPNLTPLSFEGKETLVADAKRRAVIFRSVVTDNVRGSMPKICEEARRFIAATTAPTDAERARNLRGVQWFSIAGYDRNNKPIPKISRWHASQKATVDRFFKNGSLFDQLTRIGCSLLRKHFPGIHQRFSDCSEWMRKHHRLQAPYGVFFNFCLNGVSVDTDRVHCEPHVDFKNVALGVCMIFVYGHFNHKERSWLVIWEAGIVLELPPGVFLLYPSSLFLHFNVDRRNFVVTEGDHPTPSNTHPLCNCGDWDASHDEKWNNAVGRGSMVWFNQATMFQTSELGYPTVKAAKAAGVDTACVFPVDAAFNVVPRTSAQDDGDSSARDVDVVDPDQVDTVDRVW
ncbi:hypothetical protein VNI00_006163 [Paramarasmius palmivorus]|uniref:Uncharacterized protein n=1 Tax=Paramarasmius palmivorus TaxID=297713 RepID=A0AAW0D7Q0_9AGAR